MDGVLRRHHGGSPEIGVGEEAAECDSTEAQAAGSQAEVKKTHSWRVTFDTAKVYEDLAARLSWLTDRYSEEGLLLQEEIQMLPGFPKVDDWQNTVIVPVVDTQRDFHFMA